MNEPRKRKNIAASVRTRLLNYAREQKEDFQRILILFAIERFLERLSTSDHKKDFILKGATLFRVWQSNTQRPTKDVDLLSFGSPEFERLEKIFREIFAIEAEDGLKFDLSTLVVSRIKEDQEYEGVRVTIKCSLAGARIPFQVDVGFGDAISPGTVELPLPTLLDFPSPTLATYPRETVVAEKFQAMVALGMGNSRLKDFFDLLVLAEQFPFEASSLGTALRNTFERRRTEIPNKEPFALTHEFTKDSGKMRQWKAFLKRHNLAEETRSLEAIAKVISEFLYPLIREMKDKDPKDLPGRWKSGGPWDFTAPLETE